MKDLKIGLLSVDEAAFAGGNYGTQNESYYIPKGTVLSSPMDYSFNYETTFSSMFAISYDGSISGSSKYINNVFPVLNIRADTLFTQGDGSKDNPYVVKLNNK